MEDLDKKAVHICGCQWGFIIASFRVALVDRLPRRSGTIQKRRGYVRLRAGDEQ